MTKEQFLAVRIKLLEDVLSASKQITLQSNSHMHIDRTSTMIRRGLWDDLAKAVEVYLLNEQKQPASSHS